eukprot:7513251-Pyramimonas_sp.AAC.1
MAEEDDELDYKFFDELDDVPLCCDRQEAGRYGRKFYRKAKLNGELIKVNQCVAVQTEEEQTRETAETSRVLALFEDTKGKKKGVPQFLGRWLFETKHLPDDHPESTRTRSAQEEKELFEGVDENACEPNELVRVTNPNLTTLVPCRMTLHGGLSFGLRTNVQQCTVVGFEGVDRSGTTMGRLEPPLRVCCGAKIRFR